MFITQGFFQRGWGGVGICPPLTVACPPLGHAENFILYVNQLYKGFNDINGINLFVREQPQIPSNCV